MAKQRFSAAREARFRAARVIHTALAGGWDLGEGYGYTSKQAEAVTRELQKLVERLEKSAALTDNA